MVQHGNVLLNGYLLRCVLLIEGCSGSFLSNYEQKHLWVITKWSGDAVRETLKDPKWIMLFFVIWQKPVIAFIWAILQYDITKEYCSNFWIFFAAKPKVIKPLEKWKICPLKARYRKYVCVWGWWKGEEAGIWVWERGILGERKKNRIGNEKDRKIGSKGQN